MSDKWAPLGGQAVIEGVMMKAPTLAAMALRREDGTLLVETYPLKPLAQRHPVLGWPFLRGVVHLGETLVLGYRCLNRSAEVASGEQLSRLENATSLTLALVLALALFTGLPALVFMTLSAHIESRWLLNGIEALVRLGVFVCYLLLIGRLPEVQRLFQYHGAEHKAIAAYEAGGAVTVDHARRMNRLHPRCGTSFLLLTVLVSLVVFGLFGVTDNWGMRVLSKIGLLPLVAAIAYEMIRLAGQAACRPRDPLVRLMAWLTAPGIWLQRLTTQEPTDEQLEVAIAALERARQAGMEPIAV